MSNARWQPIQGILPAIITPMFADESINTEELRRQVNRQIEAGVHGIFCLGTNGEFYSLSFAEKLHIVETITAETNGRVPVVAGVGCVTTAETIALGRAAIERGVDAVSVIVPYFVAVSQDQLIRHYSRVADALDRPVLIYNIPKRTGNSIDIATVQRLATEPNIVGIKDSTGDIENVRTTIRETPDDFSVYVGTDSLILDTLEYGGAGAVAGCANVFPELMCQIYESWKRGDAETARAAQAAIAPFRATFSLANPNSVVKRGVVLSGFDVGPAREPVNIDDAGIDSAIKNALREVAAQRP